MLLGAELHVHTDHKNILNIGDSSQQRLRWISYVDEYGPELHYVEDPCNSLLTLSQGFHTMMRAHPYWVRKPLMLLTTQGVTMTMSR